MVAFRSIFAGTLALACAGCLSTAKVPEVANWSIDVLSLGGGASAEQPAEDARIGTVRVSQVSVRAPYDVRTIAVLRADGSMAFDSYNRFAALPTALVRAATLDMLQGSPVFRGAVSSLSAARSDLSLEVCVDRLALDCRDSDSRQAVVALTLTFVRDGAVFATVRGSGAADAASGNYTQSFSSAFVQAMRQAIDRL